MFSMIVEVIESCDKQHPLRPRLAVVVKPPGIAELVYGGPRGSESCVAGWP